MNDYIISGIQQVGIGVENLKEAWKHYIRIFNMDIKILEDKSEAKLMLPYTGNNPQKRYAAIAINMQGGGGFEIWQYTERQPQKANFTIKIGDLGIFAAKIKSRNVNATYELFKINPEIQILNTPEKSIDDLYSFFIKDKYGNIFQIVENNYVFHDENRHTGGPIGAIIGVSDIQKSLVVYKDILGYDKIIYQGEGNYTDIQNIDGGNGHFKRILLTHSDKRKGAFSELFGQSFIELIQTTDRNPNKIFENRYWGDLGFIHICFDIRNMNALKQKCEELGHPFTVDSFSNHKSVFDMGEAAGNFSYIEDPDGTLIEFVETFKIPVIKKLGININLSKRNPVKPLPKMLLKCLRFGRVKTKNL